MMFAHRFVLAVKSNNKILREQSGAVSVPFGAEYSLVLRNLNSRRAMVKVSVDGMDATEGRRLILAPNGKIDLERFIKNGNLNSGNRFKFIERTAGVEKHRGIKEDDGLIRAEFWAEKEVIDQPIIRKRFYDEYYPIPRPYDPWYPRRYWGEWTLGGQATGGISGQSIGNASSSLGNFNMSETSCESKLSDSEEPELCRGGSPQVHQNSAQNMLRCQAMNISDAGITVPGSESHQQFYNVSGFQLESNSTVIVLQLRGEVGGVAVETPITVEMKPECITCGKVNKATNKFCSECGTALQLI